MIDRAEILAVATELSLSADVVEKDYVLGWLLAAIFARSELTASWIFKGGTCLKKCYFETYRFSEDLDFTVTDEAHFNANFLRSTFAEIGQWLYDEIGIDVPADQLRFETYRNHRGGLCCEGRFYYNGPLRRAGALPRIKLDLTADEVLALPPVQRPVGHPYSDLPDSGIQARCYAYEEVFGEKVRALVERTRPRDLYDVINLFRNDEFRPAAATVLDVVRQKCAFKGIAVPTMDAIAPAVAELTGDWGAMLGHQLPALPPFESFWSALPEFFLWLASGAAPPVPAVAPIGAGEQIIRPAVGALRRERISGSNFLETVRFAAANRLCVDLQYQGTTRRIEPYSLRQSQAGDVLLYAIRVENGESRSYRLDRIEGAQATNQTFVPRYVIELTPTEIGAIPPASTRGGSVGLYSAFRRPAQRVRHVAPARTRQGPTYVYQCGVCQKKFERTKLDSHLNPHKAKNGWPCPGRMGVLIETKY